MEKQRLGCIADDFTGASDAASFLKSAGFTPVLLNGVPREMDGCGSDADAFVIALKTRTMQREEAIKQIMEAAKWLSAQEVDRFYFKYCSTFDSTPTGNIGPGADALMKFCGASHTILCPALPINRRQVVKGCIYVDGKELQESSMKEHPLTPMWDSYIPALMKRQSPYPCYVLTRESMKDAESLKNQIQKWEKEHACFYLIPDYETEEDGKRIAELFGHEKLLTGGSGILAHLKPPGQEKKESVQIKGVEGKTLFLAGSCSKATLEQVEAYRSSGAKVVEVLPQELLSGRKTEQDYIEALESNGEEQCMFCSSASPEKVKRAQKWGKQEVADRLEKLFAALAVRAVKKGYQKIITAGGETSGAVVKGLGVSSFQIGGSVAPGVPVLIPLSQPDLRLVLKSGNFGGRNFFKEAEKLCTYGGE